MDALRLSVCELREVVALNPSPTGSTQLSVNRDSFLCLSSVHLIMRSAKSTLIV